MRRAAAFALLLSACATVPAPVAETVPAGRAEPVVAGQPAPIDGVLLPVPLAAYLAGSEYRARKCEAALVKRPADDMPWLVIGVSLAVGAAAGAYVAAEVAKR